MGFAYSLSMDQGDPEMTDPEITDSNSNTIPWNEREIGINNSDAWDQEGNSQAPDTATEMGAGSITGQHIPKDGLFQFSLTAAEVAALVSERGRKLSPVGFKALVSAGEAPQPSTLEGKTPLWFLDEVELWIQDRYSDAVPPTPSNGTDQFASFLQEGDLEPGTQEAEESEESAEEPELIYGSVAQWVHEFLIPVYRRVLSANGSNSTWCPSWWMHAEAVIRLEALWRAWEHLRLDGKTGMSVFMKDHLDHHMAVLTDTKGPFDGCTLDRGHDGEALKPFPIVTPPVELFPDVREETNRSQASSNEGEQ